VPQSYSGLAVDLIPTVDVTDDDKPFPLSTANEYYYYWQVSRNGTCRKVYLRDPRTPIASLVYITPPAPSDLFTISVGVGDGDICGFAQDTFSVSPSAPEVRAPFPDLTPKLPSGGSVKLSSNIVGLPIPRLLWQRTVIHNVTVSASPPTFNLVEDWATLEQGVDSVTITDDGTQDWDGSFL